MSNNNIIKTKIITPTNVVYDGEAKNMNIKTVEGEITILPNHAPLVSNINGGQVKIRETDGEKVFDMGVGVLEVRHGSEVIVLISKAEAI